MLQTDQHKPDWLERGPIVVGYDAVLVATDHSLVDYALVARAARLLLDTRNVFAARGILPPAGRFVKI